MIRRPKRIDEALAQISSGSVFHSTKVGLHRFAYKGVPVTFCTNMRRDPIQKNHRKGRYYEQEELELLAQLVPENSTILDIGANVGNHSVYFAKMMKAALVVPFEPNPLAYELLIANVVVNELTEQIDMSFLGLGLSDVAQDGFGMEERERNLGAASMLEGEGDISLVRADEALGDIKPDFIKLDVEGMEIQVLKGLGDIPSKAKPLMYVEVDHQNAEQFVAWRDGQGFVTLHEIRRYRSSQYHLISHESRADEFAAQLKSLLPEDENAENQ